MQEELEEILKDIRKIRYHLEHSEMSTFERMQYMNILRYKESQREDIEKVVKVQANENNDGLIYSESIKVGIIVALNINQAIIEEKELEKQRRMYEIMQETYYYLARYLFEYFLVAIEFGIPPEQQFIAPRSMVLNPIAKKYTLFYYRTDRPIMTVSLPQRHSAKLNY